MLLLLSRINRLVSRAEPQHQHHHKHRYRQSLHRHRADNLPAFFPSIHRSIPSFISAALRLVSDRWIHPPTLPDYGTCRFLSIRLRHANQIFRLAFWSWMTWTEPGNPRSATE